MLVGHGKVGHSVGTNVLRAEGLEKVTGEARYIDDLTFPGMLHGHTVRSTIAHGKILGVDRDPAFDWTGIVRVIMPACAPQPNVNEYNERPGDAFTVRT